MIMVTQLTSIVHELLEDLLHNFLGPHVVGDSLLRLSEVAVQDTV